MDFNIFKEAVVAAAKAAGLTEYELYYEASESTSISAFKHEINEFTSSVEGGVCFRCMVGGKMGYAATEALDPAGAAALVARAVENAQTLESNEPQFLCEGGQTYRKLDKEPAPLPTTDAMKTLLLDTQEKLYAADPMVIDGCSSQMAAEKVRVAIVNSKGLDLSYENNVTTLVAVAVVSNGKEMSNDYQIKTKPFSEIDIDEVTAKAVKEAKEKLGGEPAPTAVCPVVFSAEAMASLLMTFSSIFSSEAAQKGLSKLGDKEGQVIASDVVTLIDDPFYKDCPLPMPFDAEGSPTYEKKIIENGKLQTLFYNLKTAAVAGKKTTGNAAKRGGYAAAVGISPFALYFAPGQCTEDELVAQAGSGVYINSLGGLHAGANPVSGDFSLQSAGFLIENGKKTVHVKSFTVAGNFYDLLTKITALGDKVELSRSVGAPAVLVSELSIAGK